MAHAENPLITVDGKAIEPAAGTVKTVRGFFMVPIEGIGGSLGVSMTERNDVVVVKRANHTVEMRLGSSVAKADGRVRRLPMPVWNDGGSTYVPLRFLVESLGGSLSYDKAQGTIAVRTEETGGTCGLRVVGWP